MTQRLKDLEALVAQLTPYGALITRVECGLEAFTEFRNFMPSCLIGVPMFWNPDFVPGYTLYTVRG